MKCLICSQDFDDGWKHVLKWTNPDGTGISTGFIDQDHATAVAKFKDTNYVGDCPFCGQRVNHYGGRGSSYEVVCSGCDYLFDED